MGGHLSKPISKDRTLNHDELVDKLRYTALTEKGVLSSGKTYSDEAKKPPYWGYITGAEAFVPDDPQLFSAATPDPYAPFAFNQGIQWESYYYDDGSIYEGTMTENFPHGKGVLTVGYMGGGGLQTGAASEEMQFGDAYEGEFNMGFVHGMGKYVNVDGFTYIGEFMAGMKHGCGQLKDLSPYLKRVQLGVDPLKAWQVSFQEIEAMTKQGTWLNDYFSEGPDYEYTGAACTPLEIAGVVEEAAGVANKARMFRYKPDGMAQIFYQDCKGIPARTLQDPLHYPYGTAFLAPGPLAQLFTIPENSAVRDEMQRAQNLWRSIYDAYNFNPHPDGTFAHAIEMWAEAKYWEQQKHKKLSKKRNDQLRRRKLKTEENLSQTSSEQAELQPESDKSQDNYDDSELLMTNTQITNETARVGPVACLALRTKRPN